MYDQKTLSDHPGANPNRGQFGRSGQGSISYKVGTGRDRITVIGPSDSSRWLAHSGNSEAARRLRQMEASK